MGSTLDSTELTSSLDQFEALMGLSYADFALLTTEEQNEILFGKAGSVDSEEVSELFNDIYVAYASLNSVYQDMLQNGNALEVAQAGVYLEEMEAEYEASLALSSQWGEQLAKFENLDQASNGASINYTVSDPASGQEVTLDLSKNSNSDTWIEDPNAANPNMCDTDGDGYKDTLFFDPRREEFNVTNIDGNIVNLDTNGDGIINAFDGLNANASDIPECVIDLNEGSWELVDYDEASDYYRLKILSGTDPVIESYINIYGPCTIVPTNGTPPSEATLKSYSEEAMRAFKESTTSTKTLGEILYGPRAGEKDSVYLMNSSVLNNSASVTATPEEFENGATVTFNLETDAADVISIDCQNADANFEWQGDDLYLTLTNDKGEKITYCFQDFQTTGLTGDSALADALHLTNVDLSQKEMNDLMKSYPGFTGDTKSALAGGYQLSDFIYIDGEEGSRTVSDILNEDNVSNADGETVYSNKEAYKEAKKDEGEEL